MGHEIDSHDMVIRMNRAPDGNHSNDRWLAKHVGTKTDARFVNQYAFIPKVDLDKEMCIFLHEPHNACGRNCWGSMNGCDMESCSAEKVKCRGHKQTEDILWGRNHVFLDSIHGDFANVLLTAHGEKLNVV